MTIKRIECWIFKIQTDTFPQYTIIIDFPLKQYLQTHVLMTRFTYIACPLPSYCLTNTKYRGQGYLSRYSDSLRAEQFGDRIPVERRSSAPVQTSPGSTQPPVQWVKILFPKGKAAGTWRWPTPPPSRASLKKEYSYNSTPSVPIHRLRLMFSVPLTNNTIYKVHVFLRNKL
jgi:hypothetical protein